MMISQLHSPRKKINVAIDGPAGAGKSTVTRLLAQRLGYIWIDTGAIYRCVALLVDRAHHDPQDAEAVTRLADNLAIQFQTFQDGQKVFLAGEDVTEIIRTPHITKLASIVSQHESVRKILLTIQRKFAQQGGAILEGRDIGTIVLPHAEAKFFLDAQSTERAKRRAKELQHLQSEVDFKKVLQEIEHRDERDREREIAPLKPAPDAIVLDSTALTIEEVVASMENHVRQCEQM